MSRISAIIVSWNTRELLAQCLAALLAGPTQLEVEAWVVDNGSTDGSAEMVRARFPTVNVVANVQNLGFSRANNQILRQVQADYVLLLNPDAVLLPDALELMWAFMEAHPSAGVVGPTLVNPDGSFQASASDFPSLLTQWLAIAGLAHRLLGPYFPSHGPDASHEAVRSDWVSGACLMARAKAVEAVGMLDEAFFMYSEETDWCYRMWQAGWEVYWLPSAHCAHWRGQSSRQALVQTPARLARSAYLFFHKHYGQPWTVLLRMGMVVFGLSKAAVFAVAYLASGAHHGVWKAKIGANWLIALSGLSPNGLTAGKGALETR